MYSIENEHLRVQMVSKGAELAGVYSKTTKLEYLWNGDPKYWGKKSPVLFPVVGTLKNNTYYYNGDAYHLPRHGFARDMEFSVAGQTPSSITFYLEDNEHTLVKFPFRFRLEIIYTIEASALFVHYKVINKEEDNMYFSIGGHPAFKIPLENNIDFEDYYFEFSNEEHALRWPISGEGLINPDATTLIKNTNVLPVTRELFSRDAIVFKHLNSERITLKTNKSKHGIEFFFPGFPFLGLWSFKDANFICIEPWCGIADSTTSDQQLINKEGINLLTGKAEFNRKWSVRFY